MTWSRYRILNSTSPYFCTCTFIKWLPLLDSAMVTNICLQSLRYLQEQSNLQIFGWVFMNDHIHLLLSSATLAGDLMRFKAHTARRILELLKMGNDTAALKKLERWRDPAIKGQQYQVWIRGSHPQQIQNRCVLNQKLEYIHANPVRRGYSQTPEGWCFSSIHDYMGKSGFLTVNQNWGGLWVV